MNEKDGKPKIIIVNGPARTIIAKKGSKEAFDLTKHCASLVESNMTLVKSLERITASNLLLSQSNMGLTDLITELSRNGKQSLIYMDRIVTALNEHARLGPDK